jgi:hypothetical protein
MIQDGWSGFVVPVQNSEAIAGKIASLLRDSSQITSFGRNAVQSSKAYDIRSTVAGLQSLYTKVCSDLRPPLGR